MPQSCPLMQAPQTVSVSACIHGVCGCVNVCVYVSGCECECVCECVIMYMYSMMYVCMCVCMMYLYVYVYIMCVHDVCIIPYSTVIVPRSPFCLHAKHIKENKNIIEK